MLVAFFSDGFVGLEQLIIYYIHQIQSMSLAPWIFGFAVSSTWPAVWFFCASDYHNISIFHHSSRYDAKKFFFCVFEATNHRSFCAFRCSSASTALNFLAFESFQWPSNVWKSIDQHLMILQVLLAFDSGLDRVKFHFLFKLFRLALSFLSKSPFL